MSYLKFTVLLYLVVSYTFKLKTLSRRPAQLKYILDEWHHHLTYFLISPPICVNNAYLVDESVPIILLKYAVGSAVVHGAEPAALTIETLYALKTKAHWLKKLVAEQNQFSRCHHQK